MPAAAVLLPDLLGAGLGDGEGAGEGDSITTGTGERRGRRPP
jgi:hypothetical protein